MTPRTKLAIDLLTGRGFRGLRPLRQHNQRQQQRRDEGGPNSRLEWPHGAGGHLQRDETRNFGDLKRSSKFTHRTVDFSVVRHQ